MKKVHRSKEEVTQYIYDYGIDKASKLLQLPINQIEKNDYRQYKYNTTIYKPLCQDYKYIMEVITNHYDSLYSECMKFGKKDFIYMSQDIEDIFQSTIIKTLEKGIIIEIGKTKEEQIINNFRIHFKTLLYYTKLSQYSMHKNIIALEVKNEDNEYIIPSELYEYAYTKEAEEE